jgi:hypothetical protein
MGLEKPRLAADAEAGVELASLGLAIAELAHEAIDAYAIIHRKCTNDERHTTSLFEAAIIARASAVDAKVRFAPHVP